MFQFEAKEDCIEFVIRPGLASPRSTRQLLPGMGPVRFQLARADAEALRALMSDRPCERVWASAEPLRIGSWCLEAARNEHNTRDLRRQRVVLSHAVPADRGSGEFRWHLDARDMASLAARLGMAMGQSTSA